MKYVELLDLITQNGNRNHNPFKGLIKKVEWFVETNNIPVEQLLRRLGGSSGDVPVETFAKFLKDKIEKHKDYQNLLTYAQMMDIDKDGLISKEDLTTCILNINSDQFFKNGG